MSRVSTALSRLEAALDALEVAIETQDPQERQLEIKMRSERDALLSRVRELESKSREDAQLRGEAADAVRAALQDLRAVAAQGGVANG